jgi:hypothetical protein
MSSLAGFDLAVEIGPDGLLPQVLSGLSTLVPAIPFEQTITPHDDQGGGTAHFIIASAALTIQAEEVLRLTLHFERSSITGNGLIADTLDLAGRIDIDVAVSLSVPAHGDTTVRQLDRGGEGRSVLPGEPAHVGWIPQPVRGANPRRRAPRVVQEGVSRVAGSAGAGPRFAWRPAG